MDFGAAGGGGATQNAQSAGPGSAFDFGGANNQGASSASAGAGGDPFSAQVGATASTGALSAADTNAAGAQAPAKFQPNPFQTMAP